MLPPAPPTFSITTACLSGLPLLAATGRAIVSTGPPGANGTMRVMGLAGYCWAVALESCNTMSAIRARMHAACFMIVPVRVGWVGNADILVDTARCEPHRGAFSHSIPPSGTEPEWEIDSGQITTGADRAS